MARLIRGAGTGDGLRFESSCFPFCEVLGSVLSTFEGLFSTLFTFVSDSFLLVSPWVRVSPADPRKTGTGGGTSVYGSSSLSGVRVLLWRGFGLGLGLSCGLSIGSGFGGVLYTSSVEAVVSELLSSCVNEGDGGVSTLRASSMSGSSLKFDVLVGRGGKGGGLFLDLLITAGCTSTSARYASSSTELPDVSAVASRLSSALNFADFFQDTRTDE